MYIYIYIYIATYIYILYMYIKLLTSILYVCMLLTTCNFLVQTKSFFDNLATIFSKSQLVCTILQVYFGNDNFSVNHNNFRQSCLNALTKIRSLMEASPHPAVVSNCQTKGHLSYSFIFPANGLLFHSTLGGSVCGRGDVYDAVAMKLRSQEKNVGVKSVITIRMIKIKVNITITVIIMKEQLEKK